MILGGKLPGKVGRRQFCFRPVGQEVKTSPFHGGNMGSIPVRVTRKGCIIAALFLFCLYDRLKGLSHRSPTGRLLSQQHTRGYGGIGRRAGFRFLWETVQVRPLLSTPKRRRSAAFSYPLDIFSDGQTISQPDRSLFGRIDRFAN